MSNQEEYDELENIVDTLDGLVNETSIKYFIDVLNDIKYEAQIRLEDVSEKLLKEQEEEEREMNIEFEKSRL